MRLVLFGAPGSGKGTQAPFLTERYRIAQVSPGETLRENAREQTELGKVAQTYMKKGELVPDDVIMTLIRERISRPDAAAGFVLDGFPRTLPQAEALERMLIDQNAPLDRLLYLKLSGEELEKRLGGRWTCPQCGRVYSEVVPEKTRGTCDDDGVELIQRDDDKPEAVKRRIQVYVDKTMPVLDYYRRKGLVLEINGDQGVEEIRDEIMQALDGGDLKPPFDSARLQEEPA
jgi:adenylate kinase